MPSNQLAEPADNEAALLFANRWAGQSEGSARLAQEFLASHGPQSGGWNGLQRAAIVLAGGLTDGVVDSSKNACNLQTVKTIANTLLGGYALGALAKAGPVGETIAATGGAIVGASWIYGELKGGRPQATLSATLEAYNSKDGMANDRRIVAASGGTLAFETALGLAAGGLGMKKGLELNTNWQSEAFNGVKSVYGNAVNFLAKDGRPCASELHTDYEFGRAFAGKDAKTSRSDLAQNDALAVTSDRAHNQIARTDHFEQLTVTDYQREKGRIYLRLSDGRQLTAHNMPFHQPARYRDLLGVDRSLGWRQATKLEPGSILSEGYPVDGVRDWTNLANSFPIRVLRQGREITVDSIKYVGRDNFQMRLEGGRELVREDFTGGDFAAQKFAAITPWDSLNLIKAWQVKPGDTLGREFPFQWVKNDQFLTNGQLAFPRARPERSQWRQYPIEAIQERQWPAYLDALRGKYMQDMIPLRASLKERPAATTSRQLTPKQQELGRFLSNGKMWDGAGSEQVSLSQNGSVIFSVTDDKTPPIFVVDKPGEFAIYLFHDYKAAESLASGQLARSTAMHEVPRVIHTGNIWQDKLTAMLKSMRGL